MIDLLMDWVDASRIVMESGFDGWIAHISNQFPHYKLYSTSTDWFDIGPRFIAKLRGSYGDVIVGWKR